LKIGKFENRQITALLQKKLGGVGYLFLVMVYIRFMCAQNIIKKKTEITSQE